LLRSKKMDKKIFKAIAKKYGVSVNEVKREMQAAIDAAFVFPTPEAMTIPCENGIPTVDEFIEYAAKQTIAEHKTNDETNENGNDL